MKKVIIAIVAVGFMFCMAGCAKECNCKYEVLGISYENTVELSEGQKCSDLSGDLTIGGSKYAGAKCNPKFF